MNPMKVDQRRTFSSLLAAPCAALLILMVGCGGVDGGGTGAPVAYSQGSITGFGSIVVNDIHFDESTASVLGDDGITKLQAADLKLGMSVEVDSGAIDTVAGTATANAVRLHSSLLGPVANPNATAGTFSVVGQPVQVTSATVFDAAISGGLAGVAPGALVDVHAVYDPVSGVYSARRIDAVPSASLYRVRGMVGAVTSNTFQIGTAVFVYSTPPVGLMAGAMLRVQVQPSLDPMGRWVVSDVAKGERLPLDGVHVGLVGVVSSFTSLSQRFVVDGVPVDAASVMLPAGATLANGSWVKIEGVMSAGVLMASKLEVKPADPGHGGSGNGGPGGFDMQLRGVVTALDTTGKTFKILDAKTMMPREVLVDYASATYPAGGGAGNLAALRVLVEVKGKLSADGHNVVASEIRFPLK
jgi:hypothetical protein